MPTTTSTSFDAVYESLSRLDHGETLSKPEINRLLASLGLQADHTIEDGEDLKTSSLYSSLHHSTKTLKKRKKRLETKTENQDETRGPELIASTVLASPELLIPTELLIPGPKKPTEPQKIRIAPELQTSLNGMRKKWQDTKKLELRNARALQNADVELDRVMEETKSLLPLTFLFERNLTTFCHERGTELIMETFTKMLHNYLFQAFKLWGTFVQASRAHEKRQCGATIVRIARGTLGRKIVTQMKKEIQLKKEIRHQMRTEWRALRVQHAEKIQYTLSRHVANGKVLKQKERENAAVVLQKLYHDVYNKMRKMAELLRLAKEQNCALKIQRLYRGILARRRVVKLQRETEMKRMMAQRLDHDWVVANSFTRHGASYHIQSNVRAWLRRRRGRVERYHLRQHLAAIKIQKLYQTFVARQAFAALLSRLRADTPHRLSAVISIQKAIRGALARWTFKVWLATERITRREERRALKLLKMKRNQKKNAEFRSRQPRKRTLAVLGAVFGDKTETAAVQQLSALKIQATFRGYVGRRIARKERNRHKALAFERAKQQRKLAAIVIQKHLRGTIGRGVAFSRKTYVCARKLQSVWKGYKTRVKVKEYKQRVNAARSIQKSFRNNVNRNIRRYMSTRRAVEKIASTTLQRCVRPYVARAQVDQKRQYHRRCQEEKEAHSWYMEHCRRKARFQLWLWSLDGTLEDGQHVGGQVSDRLHHFLHIYF